MRILLALLLLVLAGPTASTAPAGLQTADVDHAAIVTLTPIERLAMMLDAPTFEPPCCVIGQDNHIGEIWTLCDWPSGPDCEDEDLLSISLGSCTAVPLHWGLVVFVRTIGIVNVGSGTHYAWTEAHAGLASTSHAHDAGALYGTSCIMKYFGNTYIYTSGWASFV